MANYQCILVTKMFHLKELAPCRILLNQDRYPVSLVVSYYKCLIVEIEIQKIIYCYNHVYGSKCFNGNSIPKRKPLTLLLNTYLQQFSIIEEILAQMIERKYLRYSKYVYIKICLNIKINIFH